MKTIFEESVRQELTRRIESLHKNSSAQWGKMNVYQMAKHCTIWNEWVLGTNSQTYRQSFLGLIFGKIALRSSVRDNKPMKRGMPAGKDFTVKEPNGNIELQKEKWIARMSEYANFSNTEFLHDFFGKMTKEEIGIFAYKHMDHHLRQFNA
jgi:hypothetical protein